jgi:hypothetical protein
MNHDSSIVHSARSDYCQILELVPRMVPDREDIAQSVFLALLEGSLRRDQVKQRVNQFVAARNREANKYGVGKFGLISADAPMFADSHVSRADVATRGLWD